MASVHKSGRKVKKLADGQIKLVTACENPSGFGAITMGAIRVEGITVQFSVDEMRAIVEKFKHA